MAPRYQTAAGIDALSTVATRRLGPNPFRIPVPAGLALHRRAALLAARPLLDWALNLGTYRRLYELSLIAPGRTFAARALQTLGIDVQLSRGDLDHIPASGPLVIAANHPHGMLDGLALARLASTRRRDVRVLTAHLLASIPDLDELCLYVDPFGGRDAVIRSYAGLRAAVRWLDQGHALIVFPSGEVAHQDVPAATAPVDSPWQHTLGRLVLRTGATVVPAHIEGRNSEWFYRAGRFHPALRTLLLGRELLRQRNRPVAVRIGPPIVTTAGESSSMNGMDCTARVRRAADALATEDRSVERVLAPIVDAVDPDALSVEIESLGADARLLKSGRFEVFCTTADAIPRILREIGRLREISFRDVGEGTGNAIDLDVFDGYYRHLFVWDRDARALVGAYRAGLTDDIVATRGIAGLYTSTLFHYGARLIESLPPAIELGRSFVRPEYQRSSNALMLLWKGVATFVARSRKYRVLFGPVSISSRYSESSQVLLKDFLARNAYEPRLGPLVQGLAQPAAASSARGVDARAITDVKELDTMIASIEADAKGIPVLLRQYLRLNAKLLGFNVDPAFGDALDALMLVDLADVEPAILARYFGRDAEYFSAISRKAAA